MRLPCDGLYFKPDMSRARVLIGTNARCCAVPFCFYGFRVFSRAMDVAALWALLMCGGWMLAETMELRH